MTYITILHGTAFGNNGKKIYSVYKVGGESVPSDFLDKAIDSATVISKQALDAMLVVDVRERWMFFLGGDGSW